VPRPRAYTVTDTDPDLGVVGIPQKSDARNRRLQA
jgi:hypothetical protein